MENKRKIFLEPTGKLHSAFRSLIMFPPEAYEFVVEAGIWSKMHSILSQNKFLCPIQNIIAKYIPLHILRAYRVRKKKFKADLIFSCWHLVLRPEPWVVEVEWVIQLAGFSSIKWLWKYKKLIEKTLSSDYCKRIICMSELTKKTFLWNLDCSKFEHKLEVIYRTIPPKDFTKIEYGDKVKILFISSANFLGEFWVKGGQEAIECFLMLNKEYPGKLEFIIRSDLPNTIAKKLRAY